STSAAASAATFREITAHGSGALRQAVSPWIVVEDVRAERFVEVLVDVELVAPEAAGQLDPDALGVGARPAWHDPSEPAPLPALVAAAPSSGRSPRDTFAGLG